VIVAAGERRLEAPEGSAVAPAVLATDRDFYCTMGPMEISDIRRRLRQALDTARKAAAERRARADAAVNAYNAFLRDVGTPVFRMFANVVKAENHPFMVFTPSEGVRLVSERHSDDFVELWLDTSLDPPQIATRVSRARGRNLVTSEGLLKAESPINSLTDEDVLGFLLENIGTLVER
jgi:hypothetical protein